MRWNIGIFIILDIIYQLFGVMYDPAWNLFYDVIHYGFILSVCLYYFYSKLISYFSVYFVAVLLILVYQYLCNISHIINSPIYEWGILVIIILLIFSIRQKWVKTS